MSDFTPPLTRLSLLIPLRERSETRKTEIARKEVEFRILYRPVIESWCRRWGLREVVAEEVADRIVERVLERIPSYDPSRKFRPWLKTVARHVVIDHVCAPVLYLGSSKFENFLEQIASPPALEELEEDLDKATDPRIDLQNRAVQAMRNRVETRTWDAFFENKVLEIPAEDVARRLGVKTSVVHNAVCKVRKMLREEIQRLENEQDHRIGV